MYGQDFYSQLNFTLEVTGSDQCITLTPVLLAESPRERTLVAAFLIDGIEMIASTRIVLQPGRKEHPFCCGALIHRPVLYAAAEDPRRASYFFTIRFYQAGAVCCELQKEAVFAADQLRTLKEGEKMTPLFIAEKSCFENM